MQPEKLKPVAGKWIVYRMPYDVVASYVKGVTLAGNCYIAGQFYTVRSHQIIDVVDTAEEYQKNKPAGKYHK